LGSDSERLAVSTTSPEYARKRKSPGRSATSESGHEPTSRPVTFIWRLRYIWMSEPAAFHPNRGGNMRTFLISTIVLIAIQFSGEATAQPAPIPEIAPHGKLRVGMLGYNPVLVTRKPDGNIGGISASLGKFIAEKLGVPLEPVVYATPEAGVQSYGKGEWDVMIGPRGPVVEQQADFGPDILLVDNIYVAAPGHDFVDAGQVDKPGVRVGVVKNGVPDQFLSRTLKSAQLVRVSAPIEVAVETLRSGKADVFASSGQYARAVAANLANAKIVPGAFLSVHMAVALGKGRSSAVQSKLSEIVREAKTTGVVQRAIEESGLTDVREAPTIFDR
jgi:polar amino acid transport system substrate-binding protein